MATHTHTHYVLRDSITGDAYASQEELPEEVPVGILWNDRHCYWNLEFYTPKTKGRTDDEFRKYGTCRECGADSMNSTCTYDMTHRA